MALFKDAAEVYDYIGGIFDAAVTDDVLGPRFAESGVILKLRYRDPEASLIVDMPNSKVYRGDESDMAPTVEMVMKSDIAHGFWMGDVNISMALAKGQMRAKGPVPKILKLVPIARELFPRYRARLEQDGRTDLLEAKVG